MPTAPSPPDSLRARLDAVRARLAAACAAAGRDLGSVQLLAVSKAQPAAALRALHALGISDFGESYAQEMAAKAAELADLGARFTFIGALQSNKLRLIVETAVEIQSVAS